MLHCATKAVLYPIEMTIGDRIRIARERLDPDVTQLDVAKHFGITDKAVSQWELNETAPGREKLPKLAKLLKVPLKWLSEGGGPVPPENDLAVQIETLSEDERVAVSAFIEHLRHAYPV